MEKRTNNNSPTWTFFVGLALVVGAINLVTMPRLFYRGDAYAIKLTALNLAKTGQMGIDYAQQAYIKDFLSKKGQFFHENDQRKKFYSRWGFFNTVIFAVPELFRSDPSLVLTYHSILYHNYLNIVVSILVALYLFAAATHFVKSRAIAVVYTLSCLYATFAWNYMRAQTYEIWHLFFFAGFFYHFVKNLRASKATSQAVAWNVYLGLLVLSKAFYILLYPLVALLLWEQVGWRNWQRALTTIATRAFLPALVMLFIILLTNHYFYGEYLPLSASYDPYSLTENIFTLKNYPARLNDYFIKINRNLFTHFPLIPFAALGAITFYRRLGREYRSVLFSFAIISLGLLAFYGVGEWGYGPRFYLFILPTLCLPLATLLEEQLKRTNPVTVLILTLFAIVVSYSTYFQIQINSRPFLVKYDLEDFFEQYNRPSITKYFENTHFACISADLNTFMKTRSGFYPVDTLVKDYAPKKRSIAKENFHRNFSRLFPKNYHWKLLRD